MAICHIMAWAETATQRNRPLLPICERAHAREHTGICPGQRLQNIRQSHDCFCDGSCGCGSRAAKILPVALYTATKCGRSDHMTIKNDIRRVIQSGNGGLVISLPVDYCRKHGIVAGMAIRLTEEPAGLLLTKVI